MIVRYYVRHVYGNPMRYPDNDTARLLLELAGHRTFTDGDLAVIKQLGYELQEALDPGVNRPL